jgi:hypothetical protein
LLSGDFNTIDADLIAFFRRMSVTGGKLFGGR